MGRGPVIVRVAWTTCSSASARASQHATKDLYPEDSGVFFTSGLGQVPSVEIEIVRSALTLGSRVIAKAIARETTQFKFTFSNHHLTRGLAFGRDLQTFRDRKKCDQAVENGKHSRTDAQA